MAYLKYYSDTSQKGLRVPIEGRTREFPHTHDATLTASTFGVFQSLSVFIFRERA